MASNSRQKTTMAKLKRERALVERRQLKQAKKAARRAAASEVHESEPTAIDPTGEAPLHEEQPAASET